MVGSGPTAQEHFPIANVRGAANSEWRFARGRLVNRPSILLADETHRQSGPSRTSVEIMEVFQGLERQRF